MAMINFIYKKYICNNIITIMLYHLICMCIWHAIFALNVIFFFICIISLHLLQISITLYYKHININDKSIFCNFVEKHISFYFLCRSRNVNFEIFFMFLCLYAFEDIFGSWLRKFLYWKFLITAVVGMKKWENSSSIWFFKKIPSNSICNEFFVIFSTLKFILRNFEVNQKWS